MLYLIVVVPPGTILITINIGKNFRAFLRAGVTRETWTTRIFQSGKLSWKFWFSLWIEVDVVVIGGGGVGGGAVGGDGVPFDVSFT